MSFQDHLFVYHAPNERTSLRYTAVREAAAALEETLARVQAAYGEQAQPAALYAQINAAAAALFETFGPVPETDRVLFDAATVALTLARNAANEAIATRADFPRLFALARTKAQEARWLACGHIAVSDAAAHPA